MSSVDRNKVNIVIVDWGLWVVWPSPFVCVITLAPAHDGEGWMVCGSEVLILRF